MSKRRDHIPLKTQLAAALCQIGGIPHEHAKQMTEDQVISLFERNHTPIPKAAPFNGPDAHFNLMFEFKRAHRHLTNKDNGTGRSDRQVIARTRKISAKHEDFRRRLLGPVKQPREQKRSRWPKGRKIQQRRGA